MRAPQAALLEQPQAETPAPQIPGWHSASGHPLEPEGGPPLPFHGLTVGETLKAINASGRASWEKGNASEQQACCCASSLRVRVCSFTHRIMYVQSFEVFPFLASLPDNAARTIECCPQIAWRASPLHVSRSKSKPYR